MKMTIILVLVLIVSVVNSQVLGCDPVTCKMLCRRPWAKNADGCDICACADVKNRVLRLLPNDMPKAAAWPVEADLLISSNPVVDGENVTLTCVVRELASSGAGSTYVYSGFYNNRGLVGYSHDSDGAFVFTAELHFDHGEYFCMVVTDDEKQYRSDLLLVTVVPRAPVLTVSDKTPKVGQSVTLTAASTGMGEPTYNFYKDGNLLYSGLSATYTIPAVQMADTAAYTCTVMMLPVGEVSFASNSQPIIVDGVPNVDCYLPWNPRAYRGTKATTASGVACMPWSRHMPESNWKMFPDGKIPESNFCRMTTKASPVHDPYDPKSLKLTLEPWCMSEQPRYETCGVPKCNVAPVEHVDCYVEGESKLYRGPINETETGRECDQWYEWAHRTTPEDYVDGKVPTEKDGNACRNHYTEKVKGFSFKDFSEPWCFNDGGAVMCGLYKCPSK